MKFKREITTFLCLSCIISCEKKSIDDDSLIQKNSNHKSLTVNTGNSLNSIQSIKLSDSLNSDRFKIIDALNDATDLNFLRKNGLIRSTSDKFKTSDKFFTGWAREINSFLPDNLILTQNETKHRHLHRNSKLIFYKNGIPDGLYLEISSTGEVELSATYRSGELLGSYSFKPVTRSQ